MVVEAIARAKSENAIQIYQLSCFLPACETCIIEGLA